jgi:hypothetical protein
MATIVDRMVRAAKLDATLFAEVDRDESANGEAMGVVIISSVCAGIGSTGLSGPFGLVGGALAALVGWFIWAFLAHFVGTRLLPEAQTRADLAQVLRAVGFAAAPGVIRIFAFIPFLGTLINVAASLWMLAAFVVAVRQVLAYTSTGRAVAVCVIGWFVQLAVFGLFVMLSVGGAALMLAR